MSSFCVLPAPFLVKYQPAVAVFQNYVSSFAEQLHYLPLNMQAFHVLTAEIPHESKLRDTKVLAQEMCKNGAFFSCVNTLFHNLW